MNFKNRKLFTLVELIIVIAIIGVLSVSAFTIVTKWLGKSRDSRRLGEINQIAKGLQSYFVENGKYPTPDMNYITLTSGANTIGYQGYVGSGVSRAIELNKITKDPMDEKYYTYTTNLQKYQLLAMLEGTGVVQVSYEGQGESKKEYAQNNLSTFYLLPFNFVYSVDYSQRYPYLVGDKLGVILANTGGNTNTPIQELYNSTTFTGINVPTINTGIYTSYVDNTTILNGTGLLQMPIYTNESVITPTTQEGGGGGSSPVNSCVSTAWLSNATYSTGTPTISNQAWQNSNSGNPCYFSCNGGYSWNGSACTQYEITNSLRFDSSRTTYLSKILGTPTNSEKLTMSFWVKRSNLIRGVLFSGKPSSGAYTFEFDSDNTIYVGGNNLTTGSLKTTSTFQDNSIWYNLVLQYDIMDANSTERVKLWVNGVRISLNGIYPPGNYLDINTNGDMHYIGSRGSTSSLYFDGYMSEINFIDGQALGPENFGQTVGGKWLPKAYTGTYGTNGFYLDFKDSASLGKDVSGRTNNWTVNNHQVTDQMIDTPTNNFATWNATDSISSAGTNPGTFTNGALIYTNVYPPYNGGAGRPSNSRGTFLIPSTGKRYWEVKPSYQNVGAESYVIGVSSNDIVSGYPSYSRSYYGYNGNLMTESGQSAYSTSFATNNIIGVLVDRDNNTLQFYVDGNPKPIAVSNLSTSNLKPIIGFGSSGSTWSQMVNFGQGGQSGLTWCPNAGGYFKYCPPAGYKALSSKNF